MDNTLVALFEQAPEAESVKKELMDAGFEANDVSVFAECSQPLGTKGALSSIKAWAGISAPIEQHTVVTVYGTPDRLGRAEEIIRRHSPADVRRPGLQSV